MGSSVVNGMNSHQGGEELSLPRRKNLIEKEKRRLWCVGRLQGQNPNSEVAMTGGEGGVQVMEHFGQGRSTKTTPLDVERPAPEGAFSQKKGSQLGSRHINRKGEEGLREKGTQQRCQN